MGAPAAILKQSSDDRAGGGQCEPASAMVPRFRFCCQRSYRGEGSQGQGLFIILRKNCVIYLFIHFLLSYRGEDSQCPGLFIIVRKSYVIYLFIHFLLSLFPNNKMLMKVLVKVKASFKFFKRVGLFFSMK